MSQNKSLRKQETRDEMLQQIRFAPKDKSLKRYSGTRGLSKTSLRTKRHVLGTADGTIGRQYPEKCIHV